MALSTKGPTPYDPVPERHDPTDFQLNREGRTFLWGFKRVVVGFDPQNNPITRRWGFVYYRMTPSSEKIEYGIPIDGKITYYRDDPIERELALSRRAHGQEWSFYSSWPSIIQVGRTPEGRPIFARNEWVHMVKLDGKTANFFLPGLDGKKSMYAHVRVGVWPFCWWRTTGTYVREHGEHNFPVYPRQQPQLPVVVEERVVVAPSRLGLSAPTSGHHLSHHSVERAVVLIGDPRLARLLGTN